LLTNKDDEANEHDEGFEGEPLSNGAISVVMVIGPVDGSRKAKQRFTTATTTAKLSHYADKTKLIYKY